jgi:DNA-binding IclR family transcriptional regulator
MSGEAATKKRGERDDQDYAIESFERGLKVLEALQGSAYEAVTVRRVQQRTGFSYDFCFRALKTLKLAGYAVECEAGWKLSVKAMQFSERFLEFWTALANNR